eukprot:618798-Pleurochrysis_carterae.AAC.1
MRRRHKQPMRRRHKQPMRRRVSRRVGTGGRQLLSRRAQQCGQPGLERARPLCDAARAGRRGGHAAREQFAGGAADAGRH